MSTFLRPGMGGGSSPWILLEALYVASKTFCPAASLDSSSVELPPPAEVDEDSPAVGADGCCCCPYCPCCWASGGSLPSLNTSVNLASCLKPSIFHLTCSSKIQTRCSAGGSGYENLVLIYALNSMQSGSITMWCVSNSMHCNAVLVHTYLIWLY